MTGVMMDCMMVSDGCHINFTVPSNLQLILTTNKQFQEYFNIIEADKQDKEKFNRLLEVRVEKKDKKNILAASKKEKENIGKPPTCIKTVPVDEGEEGRRKGETKNVFGEYICG